MARPACSLLTRAAAAHPAISKAWADSAYLNAVIEHSATLGIDVEVVRRDPATRGFAAPPRRWTVERTFGWLMLHRRLARDYEALPARSEAHDPPRDDRPHGPPRHRRIHPNLARNLKQD